MILPKFEYKKAQSITGAIALYRDLKGEARYLAGGTDLVPRMKLRLLATAAVIDLKGISELSAISRRDGWFVIGANVTLFDLKNHPVVKEYFPALYESLDTTSCETLQMRGTIGGNILQDTRCLLYNKSLEWRTARGFCFKMGGETCNVVPKAKACFSNYCSDNAPSLISLSAQVTFVGPKGERTAKLEKIFSGNGRRPFLLEDGEILKEIRIPMKKTRGAYEKLRVRNSIDYPLVGVAVSVKGSGMRVCVGGVGLAPRLYLLKNTGESSVKDVAQKAYTDAKPVENATLSSAYRKKMVATLLKRAVRRVLQEGKS
ncbi:MAG: FAD binding domain-containing protein [Deltaproteobacteria bacterium]|nr:FAD binding domain-containing protein [Deltaproteobacteria bacterium]